jgi:predicted nicotinamide N-methyase
MELGAGVGLGGIVATLAGAQEVYATDGYHTIGNAVLTAAYR